MTDTIKPPPHDEATEREVLGILMLSGKCLHDVPWLTPLHFWSERHRLTMRAIRAVADADGVDAVTPFTVRNALGSRAEFVGGARELAAMVGDVITCANITHHANILRDKATLRIIASEAFAAHHEALDGHTPPLDILSKLSEAVLTISSTATTAEGSVSADVLAPSLAAHLEAEEETALPTGFPGIDRALAGGLRPGQMMVLAARPAMGKTSLACNIAWHASQRHRPVWFCSLEMTAEALALRMISAAECVDYEKIQRPWLLSPLEKSSAGVGLSRFSSNRYLRISELGSSGISSDLDAICAQAHVEHRRYGQLGLIVVDYLQLISVSKFNHRGREAVVSEVARRLKVLALELEAPVLALAQVNRECVKRPDKRPMLSDLRESGAIEQDADVVAFVYRDQYYYPPGEERPSTAPDPPPFLGCASILFRKIRNNPCGFVDLMWRGQYQRFDTPALHVDEVRYGS